MADDHRVTIRLSAVDNEALDAFVKAGEFRDKSEVIRAAIKDFLNSRAKVILENLRARQSLMAEVNAISAMREAADAQKDTVEKLTRK